MANDHVRLPVAQEAVRMAAQQNQGCEPINIGKGIFQYQCS